MKKSSLKKRLMFSYVLVSMLLLIVGGVGYYFETKILTNYEKIVSLNLPNAVLLGDMNQDVSVIMQAIQELAIDQSNPEEVKALQDKIAQKIENFEMLKSQFEQTSLGVEGEGEVYAPVKDNWPKLKEYVLKQSEELAKNKPEIREQFYKTFKTEIGPLYHDFSENLSFVLDFQKAASSENVEKASEASVHGKYFLIGTIVAGVLFALSFGLYFSKSLSNELLHLADELKDVVQHILSAGQKMSSSSRELLNSVQHEVEAIQETSSATEELRAMVKKNEENAVGSKSISEQSMQTSILGRDAVVELKSAIDEIDNSNKQILESVQKSNGNITMISNSIREIGEKTKVINEIVFQTKLLSFNASVEAARAGEQGKGFAVVAEEVGNLAQMSGNAAKEISDLLNESINKVEAIIAQSKKEVEELVYESKSKLEKGYTASENCKQVLEDVVINATKVNDLLSEISDASKEQSIGIEEIAKAITQIDSNTNTSSDTAKNTEVSSTSLMKDAEQLDFIAQKITETVVGA